MAKKEKQVDSEGADSKAVASEALKAAEDAVRKKFGAGAAKYLDVFEAVPRQVIPTGSLGLDFALGLGGIQTGRMVEIFGNPSTGKTTLALSIAAQAQRCTDRNVLYIDVEHALDSSLTTYMGLVPSRTVVLDLDTAEQNMSAAEIYIKSGQFSVAVVDSVAALTPAIQFEATLEDQFMGLHARLMSRICQTVKTACSRSNTMIIFINQIRFKIGSYGDPTTTTGGNALPFYTDIRIKVTGGDSKGSRILDDGSGKVIGHRSTFEVVKNKFSTPWKKAELGLIYGKGYDSLGELLTLGKDMGLVQQGGAWYSYGEHRAQGERGFIKLLTENADVKAKLTSDIVDIFKGQ